MTGPLPLHDIHALRVLEARGAALHGGDAFALTARAGLAGWHALLAHWPQAQRIAVACGPGNNGGDGYVLAGHALEAGRDVRVVAPVEPASPQARIAAQAYLDAGGRCAGVETLAQAELVVDALLGIGLSRAPDGPVLAVLQAINAAPAPVLALDVPSGVDAGTGHVPGEAVRATLTLEFIAPKRGLRTGAALDATGRLALAGLGLPAEVFDGVAPAAHAHAAADLAGWLPARPRDSHKGRNGHVLLVGGDHGGGGAILLAAAACLRSGAGLVSVATREANVAPLLSRRPEAMAHAVEGAGALSPLLARADVLAIGPGLGQSAWAQALLAAVLDAAVPRVLDADALNLLAAKPQPLGAHDILTPHPGEAARLLGVPVAEVQADRFGAAQALCERYGACVVLKGAGTIVAAPGQLPALIDAGNPGMAVGGMGDALTGCIAALRAQGLSARNAAVAGALLHAAAGDAAAAEEGARGLLPSDLMPWLRRLANPVAA
jgi:NAD(P)H-hydrate epimerase